MQKVRPSQNYHGSKRLIISAYQKQLMHDADVAVIGAGPSGSVVAAKIAARGYNVVLVEKDKSPGASSVCGGAIDKAYVENLQIPEEVVEKNVSTSIHHFPWQTYTVKAPVLSVQRNAFDRFLAERAEKLGAELLTSTLAYDVTVRTNDVLIGLKNRVTQENSRVRAKLVIFADGPNTLVARKYKTIGFTRTPNNTALGAVYEIEWPQNPLNCFEFFFDTAVSPWGYGWIFPKKNIVNVGTYCLMSKLKGNIRKYLDYFVDKHPVASAKLRERAKLKTAADVIPLHHARKIYGHRILVVGDAAGMVDPLWAGGIGYGIRAADVAAKVAVEALEENRFEERFLSKFEVEWKRTKIFRDIRREQFLAKLFLVCSKFDRNAYARLHTMFMIKRGAKRCER